MGGTRKERIGSVWNALTIPSPSSRVHEAPMGVAVCARLLPPLSSVYAVYVSICLHVFLSQAARYFYKYPDLPRHQICTSNNTRSSLLVLRCEGRLSRLSARLFYQSLFLLSLSHFSLSLVSHSFLALCLFLFSSVCL